MLETFTVDTFSPHLDDVFTVHVDGAASFPFRLVEATPWGGPAREGGRVPFSLVFHAPVHVPQAIYPMAHPDIGEFALFLVPLGPHGDAMRYEAVFT